MSLNFRVRVIDRDLGFAAVVRQAARVEGVAYRTVVGIFDEAAEQEYDNGEMLGDIALMHEFGEGGQHERSWMRSVIDANRRYIRSFQRSLGVRVISEGASPEEAAEQLGEYLAQAMRRQILTGGVPGEDLAPATVAEKGHDIKMLGVTGMLVESIDHKVDVR